MRLVNAEIRGWGRLANTAINLDAKVIAIVGPNEAGKTTLLTALAYMDSDSQPSTTQRSRVEHAVGDASTEHDTPLTVLTFKLEKGDVEVLKDLDLREPPVDYKLSRSPSGGRRFRFFPEPVYNHGLLRAALEDLVVCAQAEALEDWFEVTDDPQPDESYDFRGRLDELIQRTRTALDDLPDTLNPQSLAIPAELAQSLLEAVDDSPASEPLRNGLAAYLDWVGRPDPASEARDRIWRRTPNLLLFGEADRSIQSTYDLDETLINDPPVALGNLAKAAALNLTKLWGFIINDDIAQRDSEVLQANTRMAELMSNYKQGRRAVRFSVEFRTFRITILEDDNIVTTFDERSAGLRMFVALMAFLQARAIQRPVILLIDEAENHLHLDAQADLVNMFVTQQQAAKVIYTTHSPACLPPDLGTCIRAVVPSADQQVSFVENAFWRKSAGYSPLLFSMGAGAAAFSRMRCAVLAEGPSEMILLPSLLRAALGIEELPYQVAPGLSELAGRFYPDLDFEAAKVAYLVDGDSGGEALVKALVKGGVPKDLIVRLTVPGVENLLDQVAYKQAAEKMLRESNPAKASALPSLPDLPDYQTKSWARVVEQWATQHGLRVPSKVAIANCLVQDESALPSPACRRQLKALHKRLAVALGISVETTLSR